MKATKNIEVQVRHRYAASAERVFDAWLDADTARRFLFATEAGEIVRAEVDPRVGGSFCFVDRRDGVDVEHTGVYLELDRPGRIVFSFSAGGAASTRVTIEIAALEQGCELTLIDEMAPEWADFTERTHAGWTVILDGLERTLRP